MSKKSKTKPTVWAKNQVELAKALGVTRQTIHAWLSQPGNPGASSNGRYSIPLWKTWSENTGRTDTPEIEKLKARHLALQIQRIEFKLRVLRKEYVPAKTVQRWGADLGAAIRKVVTQLHLAAPNFAGLTVPELEARLKDMEDETLTQLHQLGAESEKWKASADEAADEGELYSDLDENP